MKKRLKHREDKEQKSNIYLIWNPEVEKDRAGQYAENLSELLKKFNP